MKLIAVVVLTNALRRRQDETRGRQLSFSLIKLRERERNNIYERKLKYFYGDLPFWAVILRIFELGNFWLKLPDWLDGATVGSNEPLACRFPVPIERNGTIGRPFELPTSTGSSIIILPPDTIELARSSELSVRAEREKRRCCCSCCLLG